jgi:hypothetical protein
MPVLVLMPAPVYATTYLLCTTDWISPVWNDGRHNFEGKGKKTETMFSSGSLDSNSAAVASHVWKIVK